jgi:hypothetical protein
MRLEIYPSYQSREVTASLIQACLGAAPIWHVYFPHTLALLQSLSKPALIIAVVIFPLTLVTSAFTLQSLRFLPSSRRFLPHYPPPNPSQQLRPPCPMNT